MTVGVYPVLQGSIPPAARGRKDYRRANRQIVCSREEKSVDCVALRELPGPQDLNNRQRRQK
ncbi:hypothetical protein JN12_03944 [Geobacter argillaceus]|uniref:Uncharacterized protein n=1 Tax=Geobacter argillaceus TaxID=345631 RepID=A0A562V696_9BACT|nr:hypothetical protein JN12_03944 [Geobacter argillaceus]